MPVGIHSFDCQMCFHQFKGVAQERPASDSYLWLFNCQDPTCRVPFEHLFSDTFCICIRCGLIHIYFPEQSQAELNFDLVDEPKECTCPIMITGCKCGAFEREKAVKEKG